MQLVKVLTTFSTVSTVKRITAFRGAIAIKSPVNAVVTCLSYMLASTATHTTAAVTANSSQKVIMASVPEKLIFPRAT